MNPDRNDRSSRDYEREAEATRSRLAKNLAELSDRLTPGQVLDEVLTYTRSGGGSFMGSLGSAARQNPIPTLLGGAGCVMFMAERMGLMGSGSNGRRRAGRRGNGGEGEYAGDGRYERATRGRHYDRDADDGRRVRDRYDSSAGSLASSMSSTGGSLLRGIGTMAWQNPISSLLIGAGCAMFVAEKAGLFSHGSNGRSGTGSDY